MSDTTLAPQVRALAAVLSPRSVAVIGASRDRGSIGYSILHNLVASEFQGTIFPVNPGARFIHSLKCYASIREVPDPVDLAVIVVPRAKVQGVVEECLEADVQGFVVITAGYAEVGEEGAALEEKLRDTVRAAGARMIGPNCMGIINTDPEISLNATFAPTPARRGSIGFVSQSGALGVAILNVARDLGIGLTQFVSMGNKADVSGNDLLEHWEDDPETRVICMYLESFGNPRRFTEIAKRVGRTTPILVVKSGRTEAGARAATSHTGALAGTDVTVSAFLEQCGVLRATTIGELFDIARALDRCPLPAGNRVAIVTNAGGPAIMATDACVDLGLEMADLSGSTRETLGGFLPPEASLANPVDMIASARAEDYSRTLEAVLADDGVDLALVIHVTPMLSKPVDVVDAVAAVASGTDKPIAAVMMATEDFYDEVKLRTDLPPVYRFPESAARALARLARYAEWRRRPPEGEAPELEADDERVAEIVAKAGEGYLDPSDAWGILEAYGIPTARWEVAADAEAVLEAAARIGYPVVVKAVAPNLVHKSDIGGVELDLRSDDEVRKAVERMGAALADAGSRPEGYLVQELVRGGREVIFGISTDPRFGPLVMFGLGGRYVEVFGDVRFAVTPLSYGEAEGVVRGIKGLPLLEGTRGEPPADFDLLVEILLRLAQLARRHPSIVELDVNPFLAGSDRERSRALDVRIRVEK